MSGLDKAFCGLLIPAVSLSCNLSLARAQQTPKTPSQQTRTADRKKGDATVPFKEWISQGKREDIPWTVQISRAQLRFNQRLTLYAGAMISGEHLSSHNGHRSVFLVAGVADMEGKWLTISNSIPFGGNEGVMPTETKLTQVGFYVRPGKYRIGVILYDPENSQRSVAVRDVVVQPIRNDPLPDSFKTFPPAIYPSREPPADLSVAAQGLARLWLPLRTERRVVLDIIANFSPSEEYSGSERVRELNNEAILDTMDALTDIEISNGTLRVAALDLFNREVVFEQEDAQPVDWDSIEAAVRKHNASTVNAHALAHEKEDAAFFREYLAKQLAPERQRADESQASGPSGGAPKDTQNPLRMVIVVGSSVLFARHSDLGPLKPPRDCNCRVYYLEHQIVYSNLWDELYRVMAPLKPRRFHIRSPLDLRRAIAAILEDVRGL